MASRKYPIPVLDEETWIEIQKCLDDIGIKINSLYNKVNDDVKKELDIISINLGLLDMNLGRNIPLKIVEKELKETQIIKPMESEIFWKYMPENCVEVQKQFKGDWVGNYDSEVWLICKDKNNEIIKTIPEKELPFKIYWKGVPMDDKYGYTPTIRRK